MKVDIINIIEGIQAGLPVESCNPEETDQAMLEHWKYVFVSNS